MCRRLVLGSVWVCLLNCRMELRIWQTTMDHWIFGWLSTETTTIKIGIEMWPFVFTLQQCAAHTITSCWDQSLWGFMSVAMAMPVKLSWRAHWHRAADYIDAVCRADKYLINANADVCMDTGSAMRYVFDSFIIIISRQQSPFSVLSIEILGAFVSFYRRCCCVIPFNWHPLFSPLFPNSAFFRSDVSIYLSDDGRHRHHVICVCSSSPIVSSNTKQKSEISSQNRNYIFDFKPRSQPQLLPADV